MTSVDLYCDAISASFAKRYYVIEQLGVRVDGVRLNILPFGGKIYNVFDTPGYLPLYGIVN